MFFLKFRTGVVKKHENTEHWTAAHSIALSVVFPQSDLLFNFLKTPRLSNEYATKQPFGNCH